MKRTSTLICLLGILMLDACTESVDTSNRYVFKENTIIDYLSQHEQYTQYLELLNKMPVSRISETTLAQLLSARGNYTVFAPTNEAIQLFLDSLYRKGLIVEPSWEGFQSERAKDSIEQVIAYNSIIDGGDNTLFMTYEFPVEKNAEIPLENMYDRRLSVYLNTRKHIYLINDAEMDSRNYDILTINGVIHAMNNVIAPSNNTLGNFFADIINERREGYHVIAMLTDAIGLTDSLKQYCDFAYEDLYQRGEIAESSDGFHTPEHRYYGFTLFAETDSVWQQLIGKPALDITVDDVVNYLVEQKIYPDAVNNTDYKNEDNLLNRFVTYHFLPERLAPDRLVMHWNEQGYTKNIRLGAAMSEFYTTMGKRRLLQLFESPESDGVCINRFPTLKNGRRENYREKECTEAQAGIHVGETNLEGENNVRNGIIYPIEKLLVYDENTRNNMMRGRIRWDISAMFPEFLNNNIRMNPILDEKHTDIWIPSNSTYPYLADADISQETLFYYWTGMNQGWANYLGDETTIRGLPDMTFKLPPVPKRGVYELRYQVQSGGGKRGIVQFYWGKDKGRLAAMGIPLDLRLVANRRISDKGDTQCDIGWELDTGDDDYDAEVDKRLRNNGFMKSPVLYNAGGPGGSSWARNSNICTRRILLRQTMDPDDTYYIRFKTVMDDPTRYIYIDFLEYCPKEVYDNPEYPEDIW
ncbi:MAG: fasciclin domain-containing protein [Bacteroidaceae bacterium]|nr:fasciclin domain-containing protein [Bacteroidaceae bacterium]